MKTTSNFTVTSDRISPGSKPVPRVISHYQYMGNSKGTASGYLAVQLESRNIQAGGEITGVIHFHVKNPMRVESLGLKFSGKETCSWSVSSTSTSSDGSSTTTTSYFEGKSYIVKQLFPLFVFQDSQVAAGDYSFPFQLNTPETLPGSFHYEFNGDKADIKYSLSGYLASSSAKVEKSKAEVGVTRRMTESIVSLQESVSAQVSTLCCLRQGAVSLNVKISKSAYVAGEACNLIVEVDNSRSSLDVRGVHATVFRTVRLRSNEGVPLVMKVPVNEGTAHRRVPAKQVFSGHSAIHLSLAVQDSKGSVQNTNTVRGKNIECIYTVAVKAVMDGCCMCCGQTPQITREITVYPMQLPVLEMPQAPVGWNPTVMPLVQFKALPEQAGKPSAPPLA